MKCLSDRQQEPAETKRKIEAILERLEKLGLGEDVKGMDDAQEIAKHEDLLVLVALALFVWPFADILLAPSVGSSANFRWYWAMLELQIMWETRRISGLCLISWIRLEMLSQITRSILIPSSSYDPSLRQFVQAEKQEVIHDLGLRLIVSHRTS